jgi:predicted transcriptional regulator
MIRHWRTRRAVAIVRAVRRIKDKPTGISAQRKTMLLAHLRDNPEPITHHDVAALFGIHLRSASRLLAELVDEGLICRVDTARYHLTRDDHE